MILVSNPRYSTFRHIENGDPESTMFPTLTARSPSALYPNLGAGSRVTVQFPRGRAPTLHIRLSDINLTLEESPKTAPARIYERWEAFPPSPYTPPPFSNLLPITTRHSALTVAKDIVAKARSQYHRHSHSGTFDTRNSVSSQYRFPPVNLNSANNSAARDSKSMHSPQFFQTVAEGGGRSPMSSGSGGIWLGRRVNRSGVGSRRESERSMLGDPTPFVQLAPNNAPPPDNARLTSRWIPTTEYVSSAGGSRQSVSRFHDIQECSLITCTSQSTTNNRITTAQNRRYPGSDRLCQGSTVIITLTTVEGLLLLVYYQLKLDLKARNAGVQLH
jgi:hypothetical protein